MKTDTYFDRDYTAEFGEEQDSPETEKFWSAIGTAIGEIREFDGKAVKIVNPMVKIKFDRLLEWSDKMAKEYFGRVKGNIDYEEGRAEILLELPFFDFSTAEEHAFFRTAMKDTDSFALEPTPDGKLRLRMWFKYLHPIHTEAEREAFLHDAARRLQHNIEDTE